MGSLAATALNFAGVYSNIINGVPSSTSQVHQGVNPATGEALYDVPFSGQDEVDKAVDCARSAFVKWAKVPLQDRQDAVLQFADAVEREKVCFAKLLTQEVGKTVCRIPKFWTFLTVGLWHSSLRPKPKFRMGFTG
jgi:delta 1-pyrroline-5-carboxylate dehydrogenase